MRSTDLFQTAITGLRVNRARSALTILGIVIGVAAVILVIAVSRGASTLILQQVQGIGSQTIIVRAGQEPRGPSQFAELFTDSLRDREVRALQDPARVQGVIALVPTVTGSATLAVSGETARTTFVGTTPKFLEIFNISPPAGRFLLDDDFRAHAAVVVIGSRLKDELFGDSDAIGETMLLKNRRFRVVGVFPPIGQAGIFDIDTLAIVPVTTAQRDLLGIKHYNVILVRAADEESVPRVAEDARLTLRELHGITDPEKDDFFVATQADLARIVGTITTVLTALLTSIAAVSLLVGGVGIMNIMLVSVTERTREIGLRKALGATSRDILRQFLAEAIALTSAGGLLGTLVGLFGAFLAARVLSGQLNVSWQFVIPGEAIVLGVAVSAAVGLIFGLSPARQAARKDPIEALRYE